MIFLVISYLTITGILINLIAKDVYMDASAKAIAIIYYAVSAGFAGRAMSWW